MADIRSGSGLGLTEFIDHMKTEGLMKSNTASSYRAAASTVLAIDGGGWEITAPELIEYPFPMTTGETAYLRHPRHMSPSDVDRLTDFVKSVAIDLEHSPPLEMG